MVRLLDAVSTNETWFFRNPKHFSFVKETALPGVDRRGGGRAPTPPVSALERRLVERGGAVLAGDGSPRRGCPGWDLHILATDLSSRVLERAEAATWPIEKSGDIPRRYLKRYMLRGIGGQEGKMRAGAEIRSVVTFRRLNLNDELWPIEPDAQFDAVFCRNVLMYFEPGRRERVVRRILHAIAAAGLPVPGRRRGAERLRRAALGGPVRSHLPGQRRGGQGPGR